jgi:hypothetical protein
MELLPKIASALDALVGITILQQGIGMNLNMTTFGNLLASDGWNDKRGDASQYYSQNSRYRTWQPTTEAGGDGGLNVSFTIDHIRGGGEGDDHATIWLVYDNNKILTATNIEVDMSGLVGIPKVAIEVVEVVATFTLSPLAGAAIGFAYAAFNKFMDQRAYLADDGGRQNFPAAIAQNINKLSSCIN